MNKAVHLCTHLKGDSGAPWQYLVENSLGNGGLTVHLRTYVRGIAGAASIEGLR
jgi:hypothetical protein